MTPEFFLGQLGFSPAEARPTASEIKKRWKELCQKHHPDKGGDVKLFHQVTHAYMMLSDTSYRMKAINDERRRGSYNIRGDLNIKVVVPVSFDEAFFGREVLVSFTRQEFNPDFQMIKKELQDVFVAHVALPAGCPDGFAIKVQGGGHNCGEVRGDADIVFAVKPHPRFNVVNGDVFSQEAIPLDLMVKGGKLEVQTMYGIKTAKIKAGSKNGDQAVLRGCGVGGGGVHRITMEAIFPTRDQLKGDAWKGLPIDFTDEASEDQEESGIRMILQSTGFGFFV